MREFGEKYLHVGYENDIMIMPEQGQYLKKENRI